jgi:hypothetical protein
VSRDAERGGPVVGEGFQGFAHLQQCEAQHRTTAPRAAHQVVKAVAVWAKPVPMAGATDHPTGGA